MTTLPPASSSPSAARSGGPTIDLRSVRVTLDGPAGPVNILRGLDLTVFAGEAVGVVGPSGSGKSTMMMVIAGLERASDGVVRVAGHDLSSMDEDALALIRRDTLGIVFQGFHLVPTMTALENVAVPLEFAGRKDAFERAAEQLEAVGLGHRLDHYPGQLSGGEQQRVALARAFVVRPKVLLADEPTGNLDQDTGAHIMDLLFEMSRKHGATLLLITHDPRLAGRCDRVVSLRDGVVREARAA